MLVAARHHGHPDTVAVKCVHRIALRHEHRLLVCAVRLERVLACTLAYEHAIYCLSLPVQTVRGVCDACEEVVPRHLLHDVYCQHLQWMSIEFQPFEYLLERESLSRFLPEKVHEHRSQLFLCHAFTAFFTLSHSLYVLSFCKVTKYFVPLQAKYIKFS